MSKPKEASDNLIPKSSISLPISFSPIKLYSKRLIKLSFKSSSLVELYFINGLREGTQYSWHKNGQLKSELNYVNGKKHGSQKWWRKNGEILNQKNYQNGITA